MPHPIQRPFILGFVGCSGVGKTTLLEKVVARLSSHYRVAVIKDAHHGFEMDKPGKDSYRMRQAGAQQVIVRSDARYAVLVETPQRIEFEALLKHLDRPDILLVEGFKYEESFPKIEVRRSSVTGKPLERAITHVVAVASDTPEEVPQGVTHLDLNDAQAVVDFILQLRLRENDLL